jgi:two-component system sensor histidine kinase RegB
MELKPLPVPRLRADPTDAMAAWLLQLRWVAVAGQLLTIFVVSVLMQIQLPLRPLLVAVFVTAITNVAFGRMLGGWWSPTQQRPKPSNSYSWLIVLLTVDLLGLTALLHFTGGVANPFLFFYFVNLAVSGLILHPRWSAAMTLVAIAGVGWLMVKAPVLEDLEWGNEAGHSLWSVRNQSLIVAFAASSTVITYYISMMMDTLRRQQKELDEAHAQQVRSQQLEAMATLAAGAGHELASPLSTIAVVAKELSRTFEKTDVPVAVREDVELIRSELDRCREILARMKSSAGEAAAEQWDPVRLQDLISETLAGLRDPQRVRIHAPPKAMEVEGTLPVQAVSLALRNLLQNAIDASDQRESVDLHVEATSDGWTFRIVDRGEGMTTEVLQHIGEPFFTTKQPGHGMGLGIFLTRNVIKRLGGTISMSSQLQRGTSCTVHLPLGRTK